MEMIMERYDEYYNRYVDLANFSAKMYWKEKNTVARFYEEMALSQLDLALSIQDEALREGRELGMEYNICLHSWEKEKK